MLSRDTRIPKKLFPLLRKNRQCEGEFFSLRTTYLGVSRSPSRAVCIISKKTEKRAVGRNRLKRRVYSIIYKSLENSKKNVAIQIYPKKTAVNQLYKNLETDLLLIIQKNNLL